MIVLTVGAVNTPERRIRGSLSRRNLDSLSSWFVSSLLNMAMLLISTYISPYHTHFLIYALLDSPT